MSATRYDAANFSPLLSFFSLFEIEPRENVYKKKKHRIFPRPIIYVHHSVRPSGCEHSVLAPLKLIIPSPVSIRIGAELQCRRWCLQRRDRSHLAAFADVDNANEIILTW